MQRMDIIFKSITLIYRESHLENNIGSCTLINEVLDTITTDGKYMMMGANNDIMVNLKKFTSDLCNDTTESLDLTFLMQSVTLILGQEESLLGILKKTIEKELDLEKTKKAVITLKRFLNKYLTEHRLSSVLGNAHYRFKNERSGINSTVDFVTNLVESLGELHGKAGVIDSAIVNEIDIDNDDKLSEVMETESEDGVRLPKLKTGWQGFNTMLNGGFRRGEMCMYVSQQHKYKSGVVDSLFAQIAKYNKPAMIDPTKKPLMVLISLEDDMVITTDFMYRQLYLTKYGKAPNLKETTSLEAAKFIKEELGVNGYHIRILRVTPSDWTIQKFFDKMLSYESEGFELHTIIMDYLGLIPTTGCNRDGPMGTDLRDMFRRVRGFITSRKCLFITPHQGSMDANMLLRNGVPDSTFVKELVGKNYTAGSKQISQELDLFIYGHIAKINGTACLTIARDKHRTPNILPDELKYFYMPFPKGTPIPDDINSERSLAVFPDMKGNNDDSGFDF